MAYIVESTNRMETTRYLETLDSLCINGVLLSARASSLAKQRVVSVRRQRRGKIAKTNCILWLFSNVAQLYSYTLLVEDR